MRYNPTIAVGNEVGKVMGRQVDKLTARKVATIKAPGRHSDGGGLYLNVTETGALERDQATRELARRNDPRSLEALGHADLDPQVRIAGDGREAERVALGDRSA